jgi:hypothetical protein
MATPKRTYPPASSSAERCCPRSRNRFASNSSNRTHGIRQSAHARADTERVARAGARGAATKIEDDKILVLID